MTYVLPVFEHSSKSIQNVLSLDSTNPGRQVQVYDPWVLSHRPLRQILGFS